MFREGYPWSYLGLVRISKVEQIGLIYTERGLGVQVRVSSYLWIEIDNVKIWDITQTYISQGEDAYSIDIVNKNELKVLSDNIVETQSRDIRIGLKYFLYFQ